MFYKRIELEEGVEVQFVGVYVLKWGKTDKPTIGFREASDEEIIEYLQKLGYRVKRE